MKRKTFLTAFACGLLILSLLGCGATNKLQTITLSIDGGSGLFNLQGEGGTLQLLATGNYTNQKTKDLTQSVTYTVVVSPDSNMVLDNPPLTVTMSTTGLMTAVEPFVCTWVNQQSDDTKPAEWALNGSYKVTATFQGITSQPVYVGVASAAGPTGPCGPTN